MVDTSTLAQARTGFVDVKDIIDDLVSDGTVITDLTEVSPASDDVWLISDTSDSGNLKKVTPFTDLGAWTLNTTASGIGSLSNVTVLNQNQFDLGEFRYFTFAVSFTIIGTVSSIQFDMPTTADSSRYGFDIFQTINDDIVQCYSNSTSTISIRNYGGSPVFTSGAGREVRISGFYKKA